MKRKASSELQPTFDGQGGSSSSDNGSSSNKKPKPEDTKTLPNSIRCAVQCKTIERHPILKDRCVCTECKQLLVKPAEFERMVIELWRPKYPICAKSFGTLLGICLQEGPHHQALVHAQQMTARLANNFISPYELPIITKAVCELLSSSAKNPILLSRAEFMDLCEHLRQAVPSLRSTGLPAVLWFQLLMHCYLDVAPLAFSESETFPMPRPIYPAGKRTVKPCV